MLWRRDCFLKGSKSLATVNGGAWQNLSELGTWRVSQSRLPLSSNLYHTITNERISWPVFFIIRMLCLPEHLRSRIQCKTHWQKIERKLKVMGDPKIKAAWRTRYAKIETCGVYSPHMDFVPNKVMKDRQAVKDQQAQRPSRYCFLLNSSAIQDPLETKQQMLKIRDVHLAAIALCQMRITG